MAEMTARPQPWASVGAVLRAMVQSGRAHRHGLRDPARGPRHPLTTTTPESRNRYRTRPIDQRTARPGPPSPGLALARAVRQELTRPGSVPAQRQFELIMAENDYYSRERPDAPFTATRPGWTPFLSAVDPCPYRALAEGSWALSRTGGPAGGGR